MIKQKLKIIFVSLLGIFILFGYQNCAVVGNKQATQANSELAASSIQSQDKAMSVIESRCVSCHNSQNPSGGIDYVNNVSQLLGSGLVIPRYPELSPLYQVIAQGDMPPSKPLSQDEVNIINEWIKTGFQSGTTPVGNVPIVNTNLEPKFTSVFNNVIKPKCLGCHSNAGGNKGGVNLETYNSLRSFTTPGLSANSVLVIALSAGGKMSGRVTANELSVIKQWIDAGSQNN